MFRANFLFSFSAERSAACQFQVDALSVPAEGGTPQQMELTFLIGPVGAAPTPLHVGILKNYHPWSETPLALLLRALHLFRVEWFSAVPRELITRPVLDVDLSVVHLTSDKLAGSPLASLSLKKIGFDDKYSLLQQLPNRAMFPMQLDERSAVPLGAAIKAVSQVQVESVDLLIFPAALTPEILSGAGGDRKILRDQLPYYAIAAFDAYRARKAQQGHMTDSFVPAQHWSDFVSA